MLINVDKIIVKDRIRKDFGDIAELAADIQENGLICPIVVNKDYVLLAGERRLRAVKRLEWKQVEVRMMDTRDAEHELNIEISENDVRKAFSKSERVDYMYRLMRIEKEKARERMSEGGKGCQKSDTLRTDEKTAEQFGVSRDTMRKEMQIVENKNLLDPADFANWDEGKLSTNKAYQKIKAELGLAKQEAARAKAEARDEVRGELERLRADNRTLAKRAAGETIVVEPEGYQDTLRELESAQQTAQRAEEDFQNTRKENAELRKENEHLKAQIGADKVVKEADRDVMQFTAATNEYIRRYGGHVWAFSEIDNVSKDTKKAFLQAIRTLDGFAQQMIQNLGGVIDE